MEWIKCSDKLPDDWQDVLIMLPSCGCRDRTIEIGYVEERDEGEELCFIVGDPSVDEVKTRKVYNITHWMPLPKPPKEMNEKTDKHCGNCICECTCRVFDIDHNDECPSHK